MVTGDEKYLAILDELRELHLKKSADYGSDEDALANVRSAKDVDLPPSIGSWIRAKDKVHRIDRHFRKRRLVNESVQDSLMDLASYCIITLRLLREEEAQGTVTSVQITNSDYPITFSGLAK